MPNVTMSDEDRRELRRLCKRVEAFRDAVERRDRFMVELYDAERANPADLLEVSGLRSPAQLYAAFHRYGSERVRQRSYRPAGRDRQREEKK
jgi:hypothetical protein